MVWFQTANPNIYSKKPKRIPGKKIFFVLFCSALFLGLFWLDFPKSQPIEDHTWIIIFMTFTKPKESLADVLQNRCSSLFRKIHRKTSVFESLLNKISGLRYYHFVFSCEYCKILKNSYFYRAPSVATSLKGTQPMSDYKDIQI